MYICIFDCSVYSDREKKQRDYTLMKVKSVFFPIATYIYIYI